MTTAAGLVKKQLILVVIAVAVGLAVGIPLGWATVKVVNTTPAVLRPDLQEDYLRMAIDSFRVNRDPNLAVQRWDALGQAAQSMFERIQKDPRGLDPVVVVAYGQVITAIKGNNPSGAAAAVAPSKASNGTVVLVGALAALVLVAVAVGLFFVRRGVGGRPPVTEMAGESPSAPAPRESSAATTNYESLGVAPPITQNMTTYVLGDDLYDESFSIDTAAGDFLGEYGVGVSETIGIGEPKKVTALEIWLFDKNDIKTATKVLMSAHAFGDPAIRARLEAKGELIPVEPRKQVMLETETLQLLATVVDLQYGDGAMPDRSYFDRATLELAVWRKADHS